MAAVWTTLMGNQSIPENNTTPSLNFEPKQCYNGNDKNVCARIGVVLVLIIITGGLVLARQAPPSTTVSGVSFFVLFFSTMVITPLTEVSPLLIFQYHCYKNRHYSQYFILYTGLLVTFLLSAHTVYFPHVQWDFAAILLTAIQLLTMWFYYLFWAFRLLKKETLFLYGVVPLLIVLILSYFGVFLWASISVADNSIECEKPQWLIFSTSQLLIVQLFLVTVIYICCKLNHVRTVRVNRWSQKAQLIFIVIVYEIVSVFTLIFDLYEMISAYKGNCSRAISDDRAIEIFVHALLKVIRLLVPQIAIVIIFAPLKPYDEERGAQERVVNGRSYYPTYSSYNISSTHGGSQKDPLIPSYPIQPPLKPSSPEDHFPSLPRSAPYTPTSGYNFYNFRSSAAVN